MDNNIFPLTNRLVTRKDKEKILHHRGYVIWLTGLSGSGKTTLAFKLEEKLYKRQYLTVVFDGDNIRNGLNSDLGFSIDDRTENIRRIAHVAKLFVDCNVVVICCFISPTVKIREMAKEIIGEKDFAEVFVDATVEKCEERDIKGLYQKARAGEVSQFTGIDDVYERPLNPDLVIDTNSSDIDSSVEKLLEFVLLKH